MLIGPAGNPGAGTPPNYDDDVQSVASAAAGSNVDFVNTVRNDGNATDQINILLDGTSTLPPAWGVILLGSDGVTPLGDTGMDGIPDVGPLAPGATADVVVRLVIPGDQAAGGPFDAVIRAQSTNNPTEMNLTTDSVLAVVPAAVDIGNYNGGPGTDNIPANQNANPATTVDFALDVVNTGGSADSYTLGSSLPAGWGLVYYDDANGNGVLDAGETTTLVAVGPVAARLRGEPHRPRVDSRGGSPRREQRLLHGDVDEQRDDLGHDHRHGDGQQLRGRELRSRPERERARRAASSGTRTLSPTRATSPIRSICRTCRRRAGRTSSTTCSTTR